MKQSIILILGVFYFFTASSQNCWKYTVTKTWKTREAICCGEGGTYPTPSIGYVSREKCEAAAQEAKRNAKNGSNNIYEWYKTEVGGCECKSSQKSQSKTTSNGEQLVKSSIDPKLANWFIGIINPITTDNLLQLIKLFPKSQFFQSALGTMATIVGPILFAKGYIELSRDVMTESLNRAMQILKIPQERNGDFLLAASVFIDNYENNSVPEFNTFFKSKQSSGGFSNSPGFDLVDNTAWAQTASMVAVEYLDRKGASDKAYYLTSVAFALGGYFAIKNGDEKSGIVLMNNAVNLLTKVKGKEMKGRFENTLLDFKNELNTKKNIQVNNSSSDKCAGISGNYNVYYLYSPSDGEKQIQNNEIIVEDNNHRQVSSFTYTNISCVGQNIAYTFKTNIVTTIKFNNTSTSMTGDATASGTLVNESARLNGTVDYTSETQIGPRKSSMSFIAELSILPDGNLEIKSYNVSTPSMYGIVRLKKTN